METTPTTTTHKSLYAALMQAQKDMGKLVKNAVNPAFKSKYADLSAVIDTITDPLHNNGLLYLQRLDTSPDGHGAVIVTDLVHVETGEKVLSICPIVSKDPNDPQKMGAAITYSRRYALMALLGLAPEDDDGNAASTGPRPQSAPATRPAAPTQPAKSAPRGLTPESTDDGFCDVDGKPTSGKNLYWSRKKYGRDLCYDHQEAAKRGELNDPDEGPERPTIQEELHGFTPEEYLL